MATIQHSLRVPKQLDELIERERRRHGRRDLSEEVLELLDEALRMRRCPGIIFVTGPAGRRAVVAGTGVDVWEVIAGWKSLGEDWEQLRSSHAQLTETQLRAALSYYSLYPDEIDERLELEEEWTLERVRSEMPFTVSRALISRLERDPIPSRRGCATRGGHDRTRPGTGCREHPRPRPAGVARRRAAGRGRTGGQGIRHVQP